MLKLFTKNFTKIAGVILLLLVVCQLLGFLLGAPAMDADPLKKGDAAKLLNDFHDHETLTAFSGLFNLAVDAALSIAAAAVIYLLFRSRDRVLAMFAAFFILAAGIVFVAGDAANTSLIFVADDYVNGGAGGIAAGSDTMLELGRIIYLFAGVIFQTGFATLGLGFIASGLLISVSPEGGVTNLPRWIGWPAVAGGILIIASALVFVTTGLFFLAIIGMLLSLIWLVLLGGWLILMAPADLDVTAA